MSEPAFELVDLGDRRVLRVDGREYSTRYSARVVRMLIERKGARRAPPYLTYKETRCPHFLGPLFRYFRARGVTGLTVLEIGCSFGHMTEHLAEQPGAAAIHTFDTDPAFVAVTRAKVAELPLPRVREILQFGSDETRRLSWPDGAFDLVLGIGVVDHLPAPAGVVLEVGAKRVGRGRWRPPRERARRWVRLDLDPRERPDVVADAQALPVRDESVESVVCVEVLQYVASPAAAMREVARVLVPGGAALLAVPFFHRADDATDRHRFTERGARELVEGAGLRTLTLTAQGRFFTRLANQLRQAAARVEPRPARWLAGLAPLAALLRLVDGLGPVRRSPFLSSFATGFVALARKE